MIAGNAAGPSPSRDRAGIVWGAVLGFALGGFFDGILLHQILQWHHLLSLVPEVDSLRLQVLWDGYFHALMYGVAVVGSWKLWRSRAIAGPVLLGALMTGFGMWHIFDGLLSHWLLGIHRVRLGSPNPLKWDLIWLVAFGIVPVILGRLLLRTRSSRPTGSSTTTAALIGLATVGSAVWSAQPPSGQRFTALVFAPGVSPSEAYNAVLAEGGKLIWSDRAMSVLVVDVAPDRRFSFYRSGALLVSGTVTPAGCSGWSAARGHPNSAFLMLRSRRRRA